MISVNQNLEELVGTVKGLLEKLLIDHSSIYRWNRPDSRIISAKGNYAYRELSEEGRQIQTKTLEEYRRLHALLNVLLHGQPKDTLRVLSYAHRRLIRTIEQQATHHQNTSEVLEEAVELLRLQLDLLKHLYDASDGEVTYVPDTNALLYNPSFETWAFEGVSCFTLIFVPSVLSELDALKINHRNESVRQKANKIIRQIKEYRRRGRLTEGVSVVNGKINVMAIATEPNRESTLPWLDFENADDRFLAAVIEVMRDRPRSPVMVVSSDINLQNKAEFARIPFVEPPDPE